VFFEAREIVAEAVDKYQPTHLFGLLSGGHDSLCACHIASQHPAFSGVLHFNTGIGIEETREYVRETCKKMGWPLKEYHPPKSYAQIVEENGFPGPAQHWRMYIQLKERCLRQAKREHGEKRRKLAFVSGVREDESTRRMLSTGTARYAVNGRELWINPIIRWGNHDNNVYINEHGLDRNQVTADLCMSGECLCGAFAKPGELEVIRYHYPKAAEEIDRKAGKHCVWGTRPPKDEPGQELMPFLPLCTSCEFKFSTQNNSPRRVADRENEAPAVANCSGGCGRG
jgi:3'-phosphoadenosine 5'-phosphosulfate sulfotransferase (PAPS reductase)/FAD synthetase